MAAAGLQSVRCCCYFALQDTYSIVTTTWTELLKETVDNCRPLEYESVSDLVNLTILIGRMAATCRSVTDIIRSDVTLRYYNAFLYYSMLSMRPQSTLHPRQITSRFLDGVHTINILSGDTGCGPHVDMHKFSGFTTKDVVSDRFKTAKKLCQLDELQLNDRCRKYVPEALAEKVGVRVAAFVGRARLLSQHAAKRNPSLVCRCELQSCSNLTLNMNGSTAKEFTYSSAHQALVDVFGVNESQSSQSSTSSSSDDDDDDDPDVDANTNTNNPNHTKHTINEQTPPNGASGHYWRSVCPSTMARVPVKSFCSHTCASNYDAMLRAMVPISAEDVDLFESSATHGKVGLSRVISASRAAFKRNISIARTLRTSRRTNRSSHIAGTLAKRIHENVVDMLNVDLGLLFASSYLATSPPASIARTLPGTEIKWREKYKDYTRAIEMVKAIYIQHSEGKELTSDETRLPYWLQRVRDKAPEMFPVKPFE